MKNILKLWMVLFAFMFAASVITSCTKENAKPAAASSSPKADKIKPDSAKGGEILTLTGSGLGEIQSVVFEKGNVPAPFNTVFNTDNALLFRVPDTANGGKQNIIITNKIGKQILVEFNVIALPVVSSVSNYNFTANTQITIAGNNLGDVTSVKFLGANDAITIVSQNKKELVIKMPDDATVDGAPLVITNSTGPITTTQIFENMDKAFTIFTDGYHNNFGDASWGDGGKIYTTEAKSGTSSVGKTYAKGNWHQLGFGWNDINKASFDYQYMTFWIKGASSDYDLYISTNASAGGFASFNDYDKIKVPAKVWTYFKIPLSTLQLWSTANTWNQIGFRIQGPNDQDETFYIDDLMFVKQ
ncbi:cell shape determination protein CcmA [Mucilaginibacter terrigena]|uniref:Cell shape determination protein CcmA n=1 Tax=Mucilaginibacter terrigena TaxID=2492395 RepID=A0A4Q5LNI0_9SPHI|nr:IPT/TIG domain-containing protein [Mucilaginibacter terrigena]RYU90459.1 cell shape determination protein CcmA [Mucilaginibacter terrigena]